MNDSDLDAIRARDAEYDDIFEQQAAMSPHIAHRLVAWPVADRRTLLAYVDELRSELAAAERGHDAAHAACVKYDAELAARLAEATALIRKFACGDKWCQHGGADYCDCELKPWLEPTVRATDSAPAQENV